MAKTKVKKTKIREPINWKKELKLLPGYIILCLWVLFTFVMLLWILAASFSTTQDMFKGTIFQSLLAGEFHPKTISQHGPQAMYLYFSETPCCIRLFPVYVSF